jgi:hypothetical protein
MANPLSQKALTVLKKHWAPNLITLETVITDIAFSLMDSGISSLKAT